MSARAARFEIVRTDAGETNQPWHARLRAANGRIVWTTETYARRAKALDAIHQIARPIGGTPWPLAVLIYRHGSVEVRDVDERSKP